MIIFGILPRVSPRVIIALWSTVGLLEVLLRIIAKWGRQSPHSSSDTHYTRNSGYLKVKYLSLSQDGALTVTAAGCQPERS